MSKVKNAVCLADGCDGTPFLRHDGYCKEHVPKEASRVKKSPENMVQGYCQRKDCTEWASYHVFDRGGNKVGGYCTRDSEFLVRAINTTPPKQPIHFPPL